jgi:hypothetical protein
MHSQPGRSTRRSKAGIFPDKTTLFIAATACLFVVPTGDCPITINERQIQGENPVEFFPRESVPDI